MKSGVKQFKNTLYRQYHGGRRIVHRYWFKVFLIFILGYSFYEKAIEIDVTNTLQPNVQNINLITQTKPISNSKKSLFSFNPLERLSPEARAKRKRQETYITQYAVLAQEEMARYRIPASITLAQGLLESDAGASRLASKNNNHFGIKCFSKTCRKGHCSNFEDDTHKDFFRIYRDSPESYRAHSLLLGAPRYRSLYQNDLRDYESWAHGLKKAGYATDPKYAEKLIQLIEDLKLYRYDH